MKEAISHKTTSYKFEILLKYGKDATSRLHPFSFTQSLILTIETKNIYD